MKTTKQDDEVIQKLQKMPLIKDSKNKDELFWSISSQLNDHKVTPHKTSKLIPMIGGGLVIMIIFMILPSIMPVNIFVTDQDDHSEEAVTEQSLDRSDEMKLSQEDSGTNKKMAHIEDAHLSRFVVHDVDKDSFIIYGAVADDQLQSVIPLSIVVPDTEDLTFYYNKIDDYLNTSDWGINEYLFKDATFDIDLANKQVKMNLPESFSVGEGSAQAHMFGEILTTMFTPYQIEKVVFNHPVDLGPIGEVTEIPLSKHEKESYKIYQLTDHQKKFLIPNQLASEATIEEAIEDMSISEPSLHIYQTIPEDVKLSLDRSEDELLITVTEIDNIENEESFIIMIDALLMTAKSFNYNSVKFINMPKETIGSYQLSESIPVPKSVNPIDGVDE